MGRPFDIKPMALMVASAVLVVFGLVGFDVSRSSDAVETAALTLLDDSTDRVSRQVGTQSAGRQVVAPSLDSAEVGEVNAIETEVTSAEEAVGEALLAQDADSDATELALPPVTSTVGVAPADAPTAGSTVAPVVETTTTVANSTPTAAPAAPRTETTSTTRPNPTTTTSRVPRTTTTTATTTTTTSTTAPAPPPVDGRYTVDQVIFGTIAGGDGSNPNEESPMGRHDAPLFLPQGWNWAQGPSRNSQWGNLRSDQFVEWRCAVIPEFGHTPPVPFRINVRNGAYYQYANGSWNEAFSVALDSTDHGAYLGRPGQVNQDPFGSGGPGRIDWRQEADGSFSAPWNADALMMHFWAGKRQSPAGGQTAEFLTSELRLQQPDGQQVDLSEVRVLFQCGLDYYNSTGGQGTQVPGPGIATYQLASSSWTAGLWVTLPGDVPAGSTGDFRTWLEANLPPDVRP